MIAATDEIYIWVQLLKHGDVKLTGMKELSAKMLKLVLEAMCERIFF